MIGDRLFKKVMITYIIILLATLAVLSILITVLLNNYYSYNKRSELILKGSDIAEILMPVLLEDRDPTEMIAWLNRTDLNLGTEVWIVRPDGTVIAGSANQWRHEGHSLKPEEINDLQRGLVSVREGSSQLYIEPVIWVITPIMVGHEVIGGVVMFSPVIGITQTLKQTHLLFIYAALVSLLFSAAVSYLFSKSVFAPLEKMSQISHKIAKGDFGERVDIYSEDEIGELGEAINYMADKIEKHEKTRREFLGNVSHDLRTPLTSILGFIEALQDHKDKDATTRKRFLNILHSETSRLIRLVNELLDFTKMEEGVMELYCRRMSLGDLIDRILKKYQQETEERGITVTVNAQEGCFVLGDPDRLEQIFTNLFDNSIKFTKNKISITLTKNESNVSVLVSDDGSGIPEEDLPYIWDRFYKVDKSRSRDSASGTGLGLAIVKRLVVAHGGSVKVESKLGQGTTIIVIFPIPDSSIVG